MQKINTWYKWYSGFPKFFDMIITIIIFENIIITTSVIIIDIIIPINIIRSTIPGISSSSVVFSDPQNSDVMFSRGSYHSTLEKKCIIYILQASRGHNSVYVGK